jgi:RNA polymerase sigma-70 factor (ECF subfamily)
MELCVDQASRIDNNMDSPNEHSFRAIETLLFQTEQLKRVIAGLGLSTADAEDVMQDLSVTAIKRTETFTAESKAMAWLTRVAINLCMDKHRRKKRFKTVAKNILERCKLQPSPEPHVSVIRREQLELVRIALKKLDQPLLAPVVLKYFSGLNSTQIAETLDINSSTVRSRIRHARLILAKTLTDKGI